MISDKHIGIRVTAQGPEGELEVEGWLTGNGAGRYSGVIMDNGMVVAAIKSTIKPVLEEVPFAKITCPHCQKEIDYLRLEGDHE